MGKRRLLGWLLLLALLLGGSLASRAQSGPYGNEWIVPGQPYYKLKVWRSGLYRLDYAYLSQLAGAGAVAPTRLQLWRRGREVAVYQGGNATALDASTFIEFYGQRNDGALDQDYYKSRLDQANPNYSFFTDTAAYFVTWGSRAGKRMAQPTAAGGTPHAWRLQTTLRQHTESYSDAPIVTYLPWLEAGEGFFGGSNYTNESSSKNDSLLRAVATTATTLPRLEVVVAGVTNPTLGHHVEVRVQPPGGTRRVLGQLTFPDYSFRRARYPLQFGDIDANGQVDINSVAYSQPTVPIFSYWHYAYTRLTVPQQVVWFADRRNVFFQNDSLLAGVATYEVPGVPATVAGFDVHDPWNVQRIAPGAATAAGAARFVFPSATAAQTRNLLLADESRPLVPAPAQRVNFRTISPAAPNFVIVTHPKLQKAFGSVPNAALEYAKYRASAAGGRYDTLMVTTPLLYDQFHYGERSVLAVRHFALWLADNSPATQTKYLLLLGKGITSGSALNDNDYPGSYRTVNASNTTRVQGEVGLDLVPTTSRAPSDIFFSSDWPHDNYVPRLVTGRVIASTPEEVMNYVGKLTGYEQALAPGSPSALASWHKSVLQLVGGESASDFARFGSYMDQYQRQLERPLYGGSVTTLRRTAAVTSSTGGFTVPINISAQLNSGLQLISYFGHGSPTYTDLNIGDINDPLNGYNNAGKYPVMIYNGCAVAACFFAGRTFGGDWLLAANKGSIGLLSETGFSYENLIHPQQLKINELLFNDAAWFGRPVAEVQREAIRRLQGTAYFDLTSNDAVEQLIGTLWHGDPALRLFAPAKPDLVASNAALSIAPITAGTTLTPTTPFVLSIGVSNPARITRDSIEVRITRSYGSPAKTETYTFRNIAGFPAFQQAFRRDTVYTVTLPAIAAATGDNTFTVELDYRNKIAELDETNNTATLRYSFLQRGITLLAPSEFAIVPTTTPQLVAQSNNLSEALRSYDIQVDSVSTFNSAAGGQPLQSATRQANAVLKFTPAALTPASGRDSVVWYWRVRFTAPAAGEDASWVTGSFRVIPSAPSGGWSQSHNGQFGRDQLTGVTVAAPSNRWSFTGTASAVRLHTAGGGLPGAGPTFAATAGNIQTNLSQPPSLVGCDIQAPSLMAVVLDARTLRRVVVPGAAYPNCGLSGQTFYYFGGWAYVGDTTNNVNSNAAYRNLLTKFLDNVPDGAYVLLVSQNRVRFADPVLAAVRQKLATLLGSTLIGSLRNGEPWAIVAQKKASGGLLLAEQGADRSSATPVYNQPLTLDYTLTRPGTEGQVVSTLIGPARQWQTLFNQVKRPNASGGYTLSLIGVDASSNETVLNPNVTAKSLSLANYPAATYPYMKLKLTLRDTATGVPPQLRQWLISYRGLPEGVVRRDLASAAAYTPATLAAQAANTGVLKFPVKFDNVAPDPFASRLQVLVSLYDANNALVKDAGGRPVQATLTAPRDLGAGDSVLTVQAQLKVVGIFGTFTPVAVVNPQLQPEQYYFNNELRLPPITVADTNVPPTLDVAVDGRHILNGELVSPTPTVSIQLRDEDRLRFVRNSSYFTLYLQKAGQSAATLVTDPSLLRFSVDSTSQKGSVAKLEYTPGKAAPLADGIYTLRVQGRDPSGASAGSQDYQVKFEVVRASTITNVFPYPNPITSKARFVFTVTGSELPRNMKIQIMSLTGKVVREIFMGELGALHIGNNITDYAWDGTDQYGDRLANGTYLYRVLLDDNGKFAQRATAGDQGFKNDWGKLVLLR